MSHFPSLFINKPITYVLTSLLSQKNKNMSPQFFHCFFFLLFLSLNVISCTVAEVSDTTGLNVTARPDPYSPRGYVIRYWNKHVSNNLPKPAFLLSKVSPLTAVDAVKLAKLASLNSLSTHLEIFCSLANLFCFFESGPHNDDNDGVNLVKRKTPDANFAGYAGKSFSNYGNSRLGGVDSFKNYSDELNTPNDSFKKYSRGSNGHSEEFVNYAKDANVASDNFTNYGSGATGGSGNFNNYQDRVNVPNLRFTSYDSNGNHHKLSFTTYANETNSGAEDFTSYGKNGKNTPTEFTSYSNGGNTIGSSFTSYGESGNSANNSFKGYGDSGNNPHNNFKSYGVGAKSEIDSFTSYRDGANVGDDSFQLYARNSNSAKVNFENYGNTFNKGNDSFRDYGRSSTIGSNITVGFNVYDMERSFKDYSKNGVTFSRYRTVTSSGNSVNNWVEPGKFFRESMLKEGNVIQMPDIKDKMPPRSFLPRAILSKLPFSSSRWSELREIFHAHENTTMERVITNALTECERESSKGESKRCVGSLEDMIDFATSVLGDDVLARTTENVNGSKMKVMIGLVKGINGGKLTKSVSCHQSLYPYLLYYCHSVPKVRVYEVDIADVESKSKINHGVAICHIDTSTWGAGHGAFVALGSSPGQIEVCHWIFENDMTWTIVD